MGGKHVRKRVVVVCVGRSVARKERLTCRSESRRSLLVCREVDSWRGRRRECV